MNRVEIAKVLTDRMGEYFRPGAFSGSSWRLNTRDLSRVVAEIVADKMEELAVDMAESEDWACDYVNYVRRDAGALRAEAASSQSMDGREEK